MIKQVNTLYKKIKDGKLAMDIGVEKILNCIYKTPQYFNIPIENEDQTSELFLELFLKLPYFIESCNHNKSTFTTYLVAIISNMRKAYFKNKYKTEIEKQALYCYHDDVLCVSEESNYEYAEKITELDNYFYENKNQEIKNSKQENRCLLILGLKACYFLTPAYIKKLSIKTGYSENDIYYYKEKLEQTMRRRIKKRQKTEEVLTIAFIRKNAYLHELNTANKNSTAYQNALRLYNYHQRVWEKNVERYNTGVQLRPTDDQIADVLNIPPHIVHYALQSVKRKYKKLHYSSE